MAKCFLILCEGDECAFTCGPDWYTSKLQHFKDVKNKSKTQQYLPDKLLSKAQHD
jgi:hypothetical protein